MTKDQLSQFDIRIIMKENRLYVSIDDYIEHLRNSEEHNLGYFGRSTSTSEAFRALRKQLIKVSKEFKWDEK